MNAKAIEVTATGSQAVTTTKAKFVRFIGDCFLNSRAVALYDLGNDTFRLQIETATGRRAARDGYLIGSRVVSRQELDKLTTRWIDGCTPQDATIVARAMSWLDPEFDPT